MQHFDFRMLFCLFKKCNCNCSTGAKWIIAAKAIAYRDVIDKLRVHSKISGHEMRHDDSPDIPLFTWVINAIEPSDEGEYIWNAKTKQGHHQQGYFMIKVSDMARKSEFLTESVIINMVYCVRTILLCIYLKRVL